MPMSDFAMIPSQNMQPTSTQVVPSRFTGNAEDETRGFGNFPVSPKLLEELGFVMEQQESHSEDLASHNDTALVAALHAADFGIAKRQSTDHLRNYILNGGGVVPGHPGVAQPWRRPSQNLTSPAHASRWSSGHGNSFADGRQVSRADFYEQSYVGRSSVDENGSQAVFFANNPAVAKGFVAREDRANIVRIVERSVEFKTSDNQFPVPLNGHRWTGDGYVADRGFVGLNGSHAGTQHSFNGLGGSACVGDGSIHMQGLVSQPAGPYGNVCPSAQNAQTNGRLPPFGSILRRESKGQPRPSARFVDSAPVVSQNDSPSDVYPNTNAGVPSTTWVPPLAPLPRPPAAVVPTSQPGPRQTVKGLLRFSQLKQCINNRLQSVQDTRSQQGETFPVPFRVAGTVAKAKAKRNEAPLGELKQKPKRKRKPVALVLDGHMEEVVVEVDLRQMAFLDDEGGDVDKEDHGEPQGPSNGEPSAVNKPSEGSQEQDSEREFTQIKYKRSRFSWKKLMTLQTEQQERWMADIRNSPATSSPTPASTIPMLKDLTFPQGKSPAKSSPTPASTIPMLTDLTFPQGKSPATSSPTPASTIPMLTDLTFPQGKSPAKSSPTPASTIPKMKDLTFPQGKSPAKTTPTPASTIPKLKECYVRLVRCKIPGGAESKDNSVMAESIEGVKNVEGNENNIEAPSPLEGQASEEDAAVVAEDDAVVAEDYAGVAEDEEVVSEVTSSVHDDFWMRLLEHKRRKALKVLDVLKCHHARRTKMANKVWDERRRRMLEEEFRQRESMRSKSPAESESRGEGDSTTNESTVGRSRTDVSDESLPFGRPVQGDTLSSPKKPPGNENNIEASSPLEEQASEEDAAAEDEEVVSEVTSSVDDGDCWSTLLEREQRKALEAQEAVNCRLTEETAKVDTSMDEWRWRMLEDEFRSRPKEVMGNVVEQDGMEEVVQEVSKGKGNGPKSTVTHNGDVLRDCYVKLRRCDEILGEGVDFGMVSRGDAKGDLRLKNSDEVKEVVATSGALKMHSLSLETQVNTVVHGHSVTTTSASRLASGRSAISRRPIVEGTSRKQQEVVCRWKLSCQPTSSGLMVELKNLVVVIKKLEGVNDRALKAREEDPEGTSEPRISPEESGGSGFPVAKRTSAKGKDADMWRSWPAMKRCYVLLERCDASRSSRREDAPSKKKTKAFYEIAKD